mmetsp:Transcript_85148/g.244404  ORF Transcript_85148/g.244404 Transcript_85148/m.244404 type:complete len:293 (-) Transcript_85148:197-1075(-)
MVTELLDGIFGSFFASFLAAEVKDLVELDHTGYTKPLRACSVLPMHPYIVIQVRVTDHARQPIDILQQRQPTGPPGRRPCSVVRFEVEVTDQHDVTLSGPMLDLLQLFAQSLHLLAALDNRLAPHDVNSSDHEVEATCSFEVRQERLPNPTIIGIVQNLAIQELHRGRAVEVAIDLLVVIRANLRRQRGGPTILAQKLQETIHDLHISQLQQSNHIILCDDSCDVTCPVRFQGLAAQVPDIPRTKQQAATTQAQVRIFVLCAIQAVQTLLRVQVSMLPDLLQCASANTGQGS